MFCKSILLAIAIGSASCSSNVIVVDQVGNPIKDAQIRALTRSFNYDPVATNAKGKARIRQWHPPVETLHVSKIGYHTPPPVNFLLPKPITVVLEER